MRPRSIITRDGEKLNVNADTAATAVAQAMQAEKLVYLSNVNGVRRRKDDPDSLIPTLSESEARSLIAVNRPPQRRSLQLDDISSADRLYWY